MTIMNVKSNGKKTKLKVPSDTIHIIEGRCAIPFESGETGIRGYLCGDYPSDFNYALTKTSINVHLIGWRGTKPFDLMRFTNQVFNDVEIHYGGGGLLIFNLEWAKMVGDPVPLTDKTVAGIMVFVDDFYIDMTPKN